MILLSFLLIFSKTIAHKTLSFETFETERPEIQPQEIQAIAISIVGLLLIVFAIFKIVQIISNMYSIQKLGDERTVSDLLARNFSYKLSVATKFLLGIFLFIGAQIISALWHMLIRRL